MNSNVYTDVIMQFINRKSFLEKVIRHADRFLEHAPFGTLRISKCNGTPQFYHRMNKDDTTGKYLRKKDLSVARQLAQKDYEKRIRQKALQELRIVDMLLAKLPEQPVEMVYKEMSPERQDLVVPVVETDAMFVERWLSYEYVPKAISKETPDLVTDRGERVRSKSELIIANMLASCNIPYRYECPLTLKKWGTIYPDFTVLNVRLRKQFYWEHMGRMDDPDYAEKAVRKLKEYVLEGYFPDNSLILTYETSKTPLSTNMIRTMIEHYLL